MPIAFAIEALAEPCEWKNCEHYAAPTIKQFKITGGDNYCLCCKHFRGVDLHEKRDEPGKAA
jgi:hypothetical protein